MQRACISRLRSAQGSGAILLPPAQPSPSMLTRNTRKLVLGRQLDCSVKEKPAPGFVATAIGAENSDGTEYEGSSLYRCKLAADPPERGFLAGCRSLRTDMEQTKARASERPGCDWRADVS